jgi:drug/metabolite transporter (DMT)-like permease
LARLEGASGDLSRYATGAALAWLAVAAWTWYPIQNARWLQLHAQHTSTTWASAQGLVTLPIAAIGMLGVLLFYEFSGSAAFGFTQLGETPAKFWGLMLLVGFSASWLGTLLWNIASKNTPTALTGQLIVFETLAALAYAYLVVQRGPSWLEVGGIALLVLGVVVGVPALSGRPGGT